MFTFIRYELSLGAGLPFGALFSGLQVSQASYLWSIEFWGTAYSEQLPFRRRLGIISVISIAILLATTIGPSSAILLIPRLDYWPAGSTDIWLNATFQDLTAGPISTKFRFFGSTSHLQGTVKQVTEPDQSIGLDGNYWFAGKGNNVFQVDSVESKDWVKFRVSSAVIGYAYNTHGPTPKVAISVLLIYCLGALIHIVYAGISGISSTCWDSTGEVTALAMNSTPTAALRNTCAGITELNIFKLPVRVLAFRDEEGDGEHLELVFGNQDEKSLENKTIQANRFYGTMPAMKAREKVD